VCKNPHHQTQSPPTLLPSFNNLIWPRLPNKLCSDTKWPKTTIPSALCEYSFQNSGHAWAIASQTLCDLIWIPIQLSLLWQIQFILKFLRFWFWSFRFVKNLFKICWVVVQMLDYFFFFKGTVLFTSVVLNRVALSKFTHTHKVDLKSRDYIRINNSTLLFPFFELCVNIISFVIFCSSLFLFLKYFCQIV